jgi:hypothetical protein
LGFCSSSSCLNGAACLENVVGITRHAYCHCSAGYNGVKCDNRIYIYRFILIFIKSQLIILFFFSQDILAVLMLANSLILLCITRENILIVKMSAEVRECKKFFIFLLTITFFFINSKTNRTKIMSSRTSFQCKRSNLYLLRK